MAISKSLSLLLLGWTIIAQGNGFVASLVALVTPSVVPCSRTRNSGFRFGVHKKKLLSAYFGGRKDTSRRSVCLSNSAKNNNDGQVGDNDPSKPSNWRSGTDPFDAVRWFARNDVTDDVIKKRLEDNEITTIEILFEKFACVLDFMEPVVHRYFFQALENVYQSSRITVEDVLGGNSENDKITYYEEEEEEDNGDESDDEEDKDNILIEEIMPDSVSTKIESNESIRKQVNYENDDSKTYKSPENWYSDTDPFDAVRWFARKDVTDDVINKRLTTNEIKTMKDLYEDHTCVTDLMDKSVRMEFAAALLKSWNRIQFTVEEMLGGQVVFDYKCILQRAFDMFAIDAVSVIPTTAVAQENGVRLKNFTLVLGSSGSGKTLFALRRLPMLLFGKNDKEESKSHFGVHFVMETLGLASINPKNDVEIFHNAVATTVNTMIAEKMQKLKDVKSVDLNLHVVIDEAGKETCRIYFDTAKKINDLVDYIRGHLKVDFKMGVRLTLVGNGLEATTSEITSMVDTIKFRMQPWTLDNFGALVKMSLFSLPDKGLVNQAVKDYPILENLVSNGRCAYFLLQSMENIRVLNRNRVRDSVNSLIRSVADLYGASNGLSSINNAEERFAVVRSVFRELDESTSKPDVAFFPRFNDLKGKLESLRPVANSLLEVNAETRDGYLKLVTGKRFALSMSPALVVVVFNLLNVEGEVTWDWSGFESIVMLSELKIMVVNTQHIPNRLDMLVIRSPSPFPASKSKTSCSVPLMGNFTVILNGPRAPYADIVAPFRIVQVKHSVNVFATKTLNLTEELDKMGLTKVKKYQINQAVTDTFYGMWDGRGKSPRAYFVTSKSAPRNHRHVCYPTDSLVGRQNIKKFAAVNVCVKKIDEPVNINDGTIAKEGRAKKKDQPVKKKYETNAKEGRAKKNDESIAQDGRVEWNGRQTFNDERPIEAVFATNCQAFRVKVKTRWNEVKDTQAEDKEWEVVIGPDDVNWRGELLKERELDPDLLQCLQLRENVRLRFIFWGSRF